ncbi:hypothetical protein [Streptomyces sp. NPDC127098]|uniref:hypothetical protein n=1 Tax=Streptomyces sp. NPDC127098 TaxID=3347137 RepID=UPI0036533DD1
MLHGRLDPYIPLPPRHRLPPGPARSKRGLAAIAGLIVAMPVQALFEFVLGSAFRLVGRTVHGRPWRGGWDSDAGRFALTVFGFYWERSRITGRELRLVVADAGLVPLPPWEPAEPTAAVPCRLRPGQPPARQRSRVDVAFGDGSWLALQMDNPQEAGRLRGLLAGGLSPGSPSARPGPPGRPDR